MMGELNYFLGLQIK